MKVRVEPTGPDIGVIAAIVAIGAGILLATLALRTTPVDLRTAPLDAPTVAPTTTVPPTVAPTSSPVRFEATDPPAPAGNSSPTTTAAPGALTPLDSPVPQEPGYRGGKTPDIPPPGLPRTQARRKGTAPRAGPPFPPLISPTIPS